ncbi:MAG: hypothetical protein ACLQT7_08405 [Candidatus Dormibacteria bacterium]
MTGRSSQRSATHLADAFKDTAAGLAGSLCDACQPLLPVLQGRSLRVDELSTASGLERQSPMAATIMALAPAVAAAGVGVSAVPGMAGDEANRMVDVAESVVGVGLDALDALESAGAEEAVAFAHRLAHTTHLATELAVGVPSVASATATGYPPRAPALWPMLLDSLSTRIRVKQHWKDGPGLAAWLHRVQAASACRDAAAHGMRAHALVIATRTASSRERLIRCLTFASLYCGFAMLEHPPWAPARGAVRVEATVAERRPVPVQLRARPAYPFSPEGRGAIAV